MSETEKLLFERINALELKLNYLLQLVGQMARPAVYAESVPGSPSPVWCGTGSPPPGYTAVPAVTGAGCMSLSESLYDKNQKMGPGWMPPGRATPA